jgi:hypothetical protein
MEEGNPEGAGDGSLDFRPARSATASLSSFPTFHPLSVSLGPRSGPGDVTAVEGCGGGQSCAAAISGDSGVPSRQGPVGAFGAVATMGQALGGAGACQPRFPSLSGAGGTTATVQPAPIGSSALEPFKLTSGPFPPFPPPESGPRIAATVGGIPAAAGGLALWPGGFSIGGASMGASMGAGMGAGTTPYAPVHCWVYPSAA